MRAFLLLSFVFLVPAVSAQQVGNCELGEAEAILDGNNVRARILNTGNLFWSGGEPLYEVPADSGVNALFTMNLWVGGLVDEQLRFAGADYFNWELWPGPLDENGNPPADCTEYDRIWNVSLEDVARYNTTGETAPDLLEWPIELGAPVLDGDGIEGNYNLAAGDRPALTGNETAFWVMNDRGNDHLWGGTAPIGLEVRATAFAFSHAYALNLLPDMGSLSDVAATALDHSTLYRYELMYRGDAPFDSAYVGLFVDPDLGDFNDDFIGSMPDLGFAYVYNGDEFDGFILADGSSSYGYGEAPPALGVAFVDGPAAEQMHTFLTWFDGPPRRSWPSDAQDAYYYLRGLYLDGEPMTFGDNGLNQESSPTRFLFPGLPPNYWSEENTDGKGARNNPSDRRFLMSHGPFDMEPGETEEIYFAVVWSRGPHRHASAARLQVDVPLVQLAPLEPDPRLLTITLDDLEDFPSLEETLPDFYRFSATPNPAEGPISIQYELPEPVAVRIALYDVLGRELRVIEESEQAAGSYTTQLDGSGLPSGTYLLHIQFGNLSVTKPITIFR